MKGFKRKRGDSWQLIVYAGMDEDTKKKKYIRKTVKGSEKKADLELAKLITEVSSNQYVPPAKENVEEFLNFWLENYAKNQLRLRTYESYRMIIKQHINPKLGKINLDKLTPKHIIMYCNEKQTNGKLDRKGNPVFQPLSARTVRYHFRTLHRAFRDGVRWGKLRTNPLDLVDPPKPVEKEMKILLPEEIRKFLSVAKEDRLYPLYLTAINLGMRRGELFGLRWQDVDLEAGFIRVQQQLLKPGYKPIFSPPKSKSGRRLLELPVSLVNELKHWREEQQKEKDFFGDEYARYDLVFCQPNGRPLCHGSMDRWSFKKILKKAGLQNIRFHDLRHTTATFLLSQGVNPKVVQEILGDSTITVVLDTYSHVIPTIHKMAMSHWDKFQGGEENA